MTGRGARGFLLFLLLHAAAAPSAAALRVNPEFAAPGPGTPAGTTVASAALIENASAWDGRSISFAGEAVGEALARGDHAWLHVNDDAYQARNPAAGRPRAGYNSGQAVWVPPGLARRVRTFGDYRNEGDAVRVTGEFHAACREHGGDMDVHATGLEVVREGHAVTHRLNGGRLAIGLGLLAIAGGLWLLRIRGEHTGRRSGAAGRSPAGERSEAENEEVPAALFRPAIRSQAERDREPTEQGRIIDESANGRVNGGPQRRDPAARTGKR